MVAAEWASTTSQSRATPAITPKTTRMRVEAKNGGFFYDGATATEIVLQTEKALGLGAETSDSSYGGGPARR